MSDVNKRPLDLCLSGDAAVEYGESVEVDFDDVGYIINVQNVSHAFVSGMGVAFPIDEETTLEALHARAPEFVSLTVYNDGDASGGPINVLVNPKHVRDVLPTARFASRIVAAWDNKPYINPLVQEVHLKAVLPRSIAIEGDLADIKQKLGLSAKASAPVPTELKL